MLEIPVSGLPEPFTVVTNRTDADPWWLDTPNQYWVCKRNNKCTTDHHGVLNAHDIEDKFLDPLYRENGTHISGTNLWHNTNDTILVRTAVSLHITWDGTALGVSLVPRFTREDADTWAGWDWKVTLHPQTDQRRIAWLNKVYSWKQPPLLPVYSRMPLVSAALAELDNREHIHSGNFVDYRWLYNERYLQYQTLPDETQEMIISLAPEWCDSMESLLVAANAL